MTAPVQYLDIDAVLPAIPKVIQSASIKSR